MPSPLAGQSHGRPRMPSASFSAHCGDQAGTSRQLASLICVAVHLSTIPQLSLRILRRRLVLCRPYSNASSTVFRPYLAHAPEIAVLQWAA